MNAIKTCMLLVAREKKIPRDVIAEILKHVGDYQLSLLREINGYLEGNVCTTDYYRRAYYMYKCYRFLLFKGPYFYPFLLEPNFWNNIRESIRSIRESSDQAPEFVLEMIDRVELTLPPVEA